MLSRAREGEAVWRLELQGAGKQPGTSFQEMWGGTWEVRPMWAEALNLSAPSTQFYACFIVPSDFTYKTQDQDKIIIIFYSGYGAPLRACPSLHGQEAGLVSF